MSTGPTPHAIGVPTTSGLAPHFMRRLVRACRAPSRATREMLASRVSRPAGRARAVLAAASARERLRFGGGHLQTYVWGDAGPTALLVHGQRSCAARLAGFVAPLRAAGFRVVAYDAPGCGGSSGWRRDGELCRRALARVVAALGPVEAVVAHAAGARTVVDFLSGQPRTSVRAVSLIGLPRAICYRIDWYGLTRELRDDAQRALREEFVRLSGLPSESTAAEQRDIVPLDLPALIVHDRDDELAPLGYRQALAAQLPRAELLVIDRPHRRAAIDQARTVEATVAFVARHCGKRLDPAPAPSPCTPSLPLVTFPA